MNLEAVKAEEEELMGAISGRYQGNVNPSGQVNWRGDQVTVPQGGQSIYDYSDVPLAELGSRIVVGDRVFRYGFANEAIAAGGVVAAPALVTVNLGTPATSAVTGGKVLTIYTSGAVTTNQYKEGYVLVQSGTAAHQGYMYRIRSNASTAATGAVVLGLYDEIDNVCNASDKCTIIPPLYMNLNTSGGVAVGVAPTAISASSYAWFQTWGPAGVLAGATAAAINIGLHYTAGALGLAASMKPIALNMHALTTGQCGPVFLMIAP